MKFIAGTFKLLKDTTWPTRKQRWVDFFSVIQYTVFFSIIIFVFDKLLSLGILELISRF
ncbi:MAG: preprotein translocase subunit SecE [Streptococcus sp.]|nr:preprotein translocase subunit SecE [Streptococcus sp.]